MIADVVDTGSDILNQPAVGAHGQINHGIAIGDVVPFGGKKYLCAASFRVMRDVGKILAVEIRQT